MSTTLESDVLIVGGGMAGLSLAVALASARGTSLTVTVVDHLAPETVLEADFDGRTCAIAHGPQQVLAAIGAWPEIVGDAEPILDIRVTDGHAPLFLHYDHRLVGKAPMGYIVENRHTRAGLHRLAARTPGVTLLAPAALADIRRDPDRVRATLADGRTVVSRLIVGADGRRSAVRRHADIRQAEWSYDQTAIVCTVAHEQPHRGVAHECFLPAGPFAMLPMTGRRCSVVWTERSRLAPHMLGLPQADFEDEMQRRFGDWFGRLSLVSPRWSWPLTLQHADRYIDHRLALVGDAAHGVHPIAGQGLNMGLRDVAALAECVVGAARLGLDIAGADVLARYQRWRRFDNTTVLASTDAINRLFSNDLPPVRLARDLGLAAVDRVAPLKRFFMRHAMGVVGDLPRLVQGRAL